MVLWSSTQSFTFTGPASATALVDITDTGIVPNDVVMPTHITLPFSGFVVTQLAEMPKPPYTVTITGTISPPTTNPAGVFLGPLPMWRDLITGVISTNGLGWGGLNFDPGTTTDSTSIDIPELVPPGMFGGTGANAPLTHWSWTIATNFDDTTTYTINCTVSFEYTAACWDGIDTRILPASGGTTIDITSTALPTGPTFPTSIAGVTAVAITPGVSDYTVTCSTDTRPAGEVDVWFVTFDSLGAILSTELVGQFTPSIPAWLGQDSTLISGARYWAVYVSNAAGDSGHTLATNVRFYCTGVTPVVQFGDFVAGIGVAANSAPRRRAGHGRVWMVA